MVGDGKEIKTRHIACVYVCVTGSTHAVGIGGVSVQLALIEAHDVGGVAAAEMMRVLRRSSGGIKDSQLKLIRAGNKLHSGKYDRAVAPLCASGVIHVSYLEHAF